MASACLRAELHAEPSVCRYIRRQPEKTLLYQAVQDHLGTFLAQCDTVERSIPSFIKLVAFSCKKRGFCGSCMSRRMSETASHLVDSVIPFIPTRQWVLSVPVSLRYLMAYDNKALSYVIDAYTGSIFSWLRKKARQTELGMTSNSLQPGVITFVQRFGSALNLNVHLHGQFSDGVFLKTALGQVVFQKTRAPTLADIRNITEKVAKRVHRWLEKRVQKMGEEDALQQEQPLLASCYASSLRYLTAFGNNAGRPLMRVFENMPEDSRPEST